jgi:hypothetical protein
MQETAAHFLKASMEIKIIHKERKNKKEKEGKNEKNKNSIILTNEPAQ